LVAIEVNPETERGTELVVTLGQNPPVLAPVTIVPPLVTAITNSKSTPDVTISSITEAVKNTFVVGVPVYLSCPSVFISNSLAVGAVLKVNVAAVSIATMLVKELGDTLAAPAIVVAPAVLT